jgi:hypothetical protein
MDPIVVKVNVGAATNHVFMGRREMLVAEELRRGGIPAHGGAHGITVKEGELTVHEEGGLRVFTWQPPEAAQGEGEVVKVPVPAGDNNLEVQALEAQSQEVTKHHVAFLKSCGYKPKNVAAAKKFVDAMEPKEREGFFVDAAQWKADDSADERADSDE